MLGQHDDVERVVTAALASELTDAQRGVLSRRLAGTRFSSRRDLAGALAALDAAQDLVRDPEELGALQASPSDAAGGRRSPRRRPGGPRLDRGAGRPAGPGRARVGPGGEPAERRPSRRSRGAGAPQRGRPCGAARVAGPARYRRPPRQRGPRPRLQRPIRRGPPARRARRRAGPRGERDGGVGVVRDGARRDRPRHGSGRRGDPPVHMPRPARRPRRARRRRWCGPTSASPRAICCSASAVRPRRRWREPTPSATARWRRRSRRASGRGPGSRPAAATWSPRRARLRDVLEVVQRDGVRTFEPAVLNDLVRFGRAEETVERLRWLVGVVDGPLVQAHYGHAVAVAEGDADALQVVVDDYEALDVLALRGGGRGRAGRVAPAAR